MIVDSPVRKTLCKKFWFSMQDSIGLPIIDPGGHPKPLGPRARLGEGHIQGAFAVELYRVPKQRTRGRIGPEAIKEYGIKKMSVCYVYFNVFARHERNVRFSSPSFP